MQKAVSYLKIHTSFALNGFHIGYEIAAITLPGVERRPFPLDAAAWVLPSLPGAVPVEAKLCQNAGDRRGLLVGELNPCVDGSGGVKRF
jgi:hypothetical protein